MSFALLGLGTAVPSTRLTQEEAAGIARRLCCRTPEQQTWLPMMYQGTGIRSRYLTFERQLIDDLLHGTTLSESIFLPKDGDEDCGPTTAQRLRIYAEQAGVLALRAASQALRSSGFQKADITHLITVSCTGMQAPGVDYDLIAGLGLAPTVQRTHLGFMGCHGALNGLRVARAFADAEPQARILLCAVELCGLHYHYGWDPQRIVANALFADGAAAVVGRNEQTPGTWRVTANGSCLIPDSREAMSWIIGDYGFEMTLSKRVPELIRAHLRPWLEHWLRERGLDCEQIGSWAIHPGGPRILDATIQALHLGEDRLAVTREVFATYGNMSSPTVLFIVEQLRAQQAALPCVALGFGPGLAVEAVLLE